MPSGSKFSLVLFLTLVYLSHGAGAQSRWVHFGAHGKLVYAQTAKGDRIPDFSYAGYEGGGVALPDVAAKRKVAPAGGDDTAAIQSAIDAVRGVAAGGWISRCGGIGGGDVSLFGDNCNHCERRGVARGGCREDGTTVMMTGAPHLALRMTGQLEQKRRARRRRSRMRMYRQAR